MTNEGKLVRANGIDIHYVEAGKGAPLVLLPGGLMSTSSMWAKFPAAYVGHMPALAERYRVIAPDLRGHGKTKNPGGKISYSQMADDMLAFLDALGIERPLLCGFSLGATVATIAAMRRPEAVRALVNHAGYDVFNPNPQARVFGIARQVFGGRPDATEADPNAAEQFFVSHGMGAFIELLRADVDGAQGAGAWKTLLANLFDTLTTPAPHPLDDFRKITAPSLILTGDRDMTCSAEEAVQAFRQLPAGELAILPGEGHVVSPASIATTLAFFERHTRS